jgi:hypothetical protein
MVDAGLDGSCYYHIRDYHVSRERFARIFSPDGAAFMARWWNRMPQFDGLFDYQNTVRPAYFAFKLLSRCSGERLKLSSSDPAVHGFFVHDEKLRLYCLLLWNFSGSAKRVELELSGIPRGLRARPIVLNANAPSSDENARLRPEPAPDLKAAAAKANQEKLQVELDAYAVKYWSFE